MVWCEGEVAGKTKWSYSLPSGVHLAAASTDHETCKNHACPPYRPSGSISVLVTLNETCIQMLQSDAVEVAWFGGKSYR